MVSQCFSLFQQRVCPICKRTFADLPSHLRRQHHVVNATEFRLILRLASARLKDSLACPLCEKIFSRLDMHLASRHKLSGSDLEVVLSSAKRECILDKLAKLRHSQPTPPMASMLDLLRVKVQPEHRSETVLVSQSMPTNMEPNGSPEPHSVPEIPSTIMPALSAPNTPRLEPPTPHSSSAGSSRENSPRTPTEFPSPIIQRVLRDFYEFSLPSNPSNKDMENAQQRRSHALRFLQHMAAGFSDQQLKNLKFLEDFLRLRQWPADLAHKGYAPTSIKVMLLNASAFVNHFKAFHLEISGLSSNKLERILLQLRRLSRDNTRAVLSHRQRAKRKKSESLQTSTELQSFIRKAERNLPRVMDDIRTKPTSKLYRIAQGYVAGYLAVLTGHRPIVFCNITKADLLEAEKDPLGRTLVWVARHKTDRAFGNAHLALLPKEADWLRGLAEISSLYGGEQCPYIFQWNGKQVQKLNRMLRAAWQVAGMTGDIAFSLIRTSIAIEAKKHLSHSDRLLVCNSMCHDISTAERFYTDVPNLSEVFRIRDLRTQALNSSADPLDASSDPESSSSESSCSPDNQ
ncbi:hypothetical protein AMEX_G27981 [Astyanax mexicanus]|uniref:Uncharacterized protein n=1 Tax=Astyanax mexicanus TaxID=7994 RepID=A0A8T2KRM2_ASTMX|nr:hypothetical protein AMEX_G27981 [Astyanax mexicanus]